MIVNADMAALVAASTTTPTPAGWPTSLPTTALPATPMPTQQTNNLNSQDFMAGSHNIPGGAQTPALGFDFMQFNFNGINFDELDVNFIQQASQPIFGQDIANPFAAANGSFEVCLVV
jgi:hypothetical protein